MLRAMLPIMCLALVLLGHVVPASAAKRVALVIGNSAYQHTTQLTNPMNDASDMAASLRRLGFDVTTGLDLTEERFLDVISAFSDKLSDADVALFFYAGHGVQYQNVNYLIPVDAELRDEFRLKRETIALADIIEQMESRVPVNLVFLDACRDNPLADTLKRGLRGKGRSAFVGRGLARVESGGKDTLITFAAAPGAVAADGVGRNSPFTSALLKHMETPNVEVEVMMKRVTGDVRRSTSTRQEPERLSRLTVEFYFKPDGLAVKVEQTPAPAQNPIDPAAQAWAVTKDTKSPAVLEAFIKQYPGSVYATFAKARLKEVTEKKVAARQIKRCTFKIRDKQYALTFTGQADGLIADYNLRGGEIRGGLKNGFLEGIWSQEAADKDCSKKDPYGISYSWGKVWGRVTRTGFNWTWTYCGETKERSWRGSCLAQ